MAKVVIPLVIGVGLIYWLYSKIDTSQMLDIMRTDINYWWIVLAMAISVFSHIFRAMRWRLQLRGLGIKAPLSSLIMSIFGCYAMNLVFPRAGEVWRSIYVADRQKTSFTTVVGSMIGDRLADTLTVLLLTVFTFFLAQDAFWAFLDTYPQVKDGLIRTATSPVTWGVVVAGVAALVWLFRSRSENKVVTQVRTAVRNLWEGFAVIARMEGKWQFLLYTVLIWGCYFMQLYVATFAFSYTAELGVVATLVLFVLSSIGMGIPTNGGLGAWHLAIIFGLSLYGIGSPFDPNNLDVNASTFAMVVWGAQTLMLILLGIYSIVFFYVERHRIATGQITVERTADGGMKL